MAGTKTKLGWFLVVAAGVACARTGLSPGQQIAPQSTTDGGGVGGAGGVGATTASCTPRASNEAPVENGGGVATDSEIGVTVSCGDPPLDRGAFTLRVMLHGHEIDGRASSDGERFTFMPRRRLGLATTYVAKVGSGTWQFSWTFVTRDGVWTEAERVGPGTPRDVALNADGRGALLFLERTDDHSTLNVRGRSGDALELGELEEVRDGDPVSVHGATLAVDAQARLLVAWTEYRQSVYSIWARQSADDGGWADPIALPDGGGYEELHDAVLWADGTGLVAWRDNPSNWGEHQRLMVASLNPRGLVESVVVADMMPVDGARMALQSDGSAWVVWGSWLRWGRFLARRHDPAGVWGELFVVAEQSARAPQIALDSGGTGFIGWNATDLIARQPTPGDTLGATVPLDTQGDRGENSGVSLRLAVDPFGNALALWVNNPHFVISQNGPGTSFGKVSEVRVQQFLRNGGWADRHVAIDVAAAPDATSGNRNLSRRALALDDQGDGFAAWSQTYPPNEREARSARFVTSGGWATSVQHAVAANAPLVAVDSIGRGIAAWASDGSVYIARFLEP